MYAVLIESVFKKQKCFLCFFFTVVFFSQEKCFLVLFFIKMFFFNNDGKNYCLYSNLSQFPYSSKFFCLASLGILAHIYIMITLLIIYHYCNIKCGKEAWRLQMYVGVEKYSSKWYYMPSISNREIEIWNRHWHIYCKWQPYEGVKRIKMA